MDQQYVTFFVGVAALVAGWITAGYQRITEKVIEERRAALIGLLEAVEKTRSGSADNPEKLRMSASRAELLCSPQMNKSGLVPRLVAAANDTSYERTRSLFVRAARAEGTSKSMFALAIWWRLHRGTFAAADRAVGH